MLRLLIILSLMALVPSSSFSINSYLTAYFSHNSPTSEKVVAYGVRHFHPLAVKKALAQQKYGANQWLFYQAFLATQFVENAIELGEYWQDKKPKKAEFWYQKALQFNDERANFSVARWYFSQQQWQDAVKLLHGVSTTQLLEQKLIDDYLTSLLRLGKQQQFKTVYLTALNQPLFRSQARWQHDIQTFQLIEQDFSNVSASCENSIQPIATNLYDLRYWQQLAEQIKTMPIIQFVCLAPVRYLPVTHLGCNNSLTEQPISCHFEQAQTVLKSVKSRYLLVLLPKGGANSQWGVAYLDAADSVYVLQHELLHLLGLVDEYALASDHEFCQLPTHSSMNIVLLAKYYTDTSILTKQKILAKIPWADQLNLTQIQFKPSPFGYELKTTTDVNHKKAGLYLAKTCDNNTQANNLIALKPLNQVTVLLQNQAELPELYRQLIEKWQFKFKMPSFHYTLAYQAFVKGNIERANKWLAAATKHEADKQRKVAIKQGDFEQVFVNFTVK